MELVSHDVRKFFALLLGRNGYVLEQLFSPLVVATSEAHREALAIAPRCITRGHAEHYLGFAETQWRLVERKGPRVKLLLYVVRVLLTGIHLMRTGQIEANLARLNERFRLSYVPDLIALKMAKEENVQGAPATLAFYEEEYRRLRAALSDAAAASTLPETPGGRAELNALLLRLRRSPAAS